MLKLASRSLFARLALLLIMALVPALTLGRAGIVLSERSQEAETSGAQRSADAESDPGEVEVVQPAMRSAAHRARALRPASGDTAELPRFALVADLRLTRSFSPVPHPPIRRPPLRLLN